MIKYILWGLVALVAIVVLGWGLMASNIVTWSIQREAVQHSQPYVETKVSLLHKLHNDWLQLDAEIAELRSTEDSRPIIKAKQAQQKNIVIRMAEEAELIPASQIPASIGNFLRSQ